MSNYNTKIVKNKEFKEKKYNSHLNSDERANIELLIKENYSIKEIAAALNRPITTIYSELKSKSVTLPAKMPCKKCLNNKDCLNICNKYMMNLTCKSNCSKTCCKKACKKAKYKKCNFLNKAGTCDGCSKFNSCTKSKIIYSKQGAQNQYIINRSRCVKKLKLISDKPLLKYIKEQIINNKYSPDVIRGRLNVVSKNSFTVSFCTATLYNYINKSLIPGVKNIDLKLKCKLKQSKEPRQSTGLNKHREGREIEKRTDEENTPTSIGHYELDLVEGVKGGALLLTFIDRFSSELYIRKIPNKTQPEVEKALYNIKETIIKKYGENIIQTITTDNGSEFLNFTELEKLPNNNKCKLYYAMPYCSWQKGKIEQANWVIRTYINKGTDITPYSNFDISKIEYKINSMPRKRLNYLSALEYSQKNIA